ncbi:MAG: dihydropteroate synthase [Dehalococcoidia bacterium]
MSSGLATARRSPAPITIRGRNFAWGERTYVIGIINVTPDSFSGDGVTSVEAAVRQGVEMAAAGADMLDVGGESTRPGGQAISADEEMARVMPVIERLVREIELPLSIDAYKSDVARAALDAGAHLVNDIRGFQADPAMARLCAERGVPAIVMHNQRGRPHHDVAGDILAGLRESLAIAREAGLPEELIIVDPGFGFGWEVEQNIEMLARLPELLELGRPLLVGTSRKSTLGAITGRAVEDRLAATAASVALSVVGGADLVRVHDVEFMVDVCKVADAVVRRSGR